MGSYIPGGGSSALGGFDAYDSSYLGGVFVAAAGPMNRMSIDLPAPDVTVGSTFAVAGWALEEQTIPRRLIPPDAYKPLPDPNPVDTIHVWAFPLSGAPPIFLGAATVGDARPDVAAVFGDRFLKAGYHLNVAGALPVGDYDVVVYVHNVVSQTFNNRRLARVRVR